MLKELLPSGTPIDRYKQRLSAHTTAAWLAQLFNSQLDEADKRAALNAHGDNSPHAQPGAGRPVRLQYVDACIVRFGNEYRLQEAFVAADARQSFSTPQAPEGQPAEAWEAAAAFTHWTYHATDGRAMVMELQVCAVTVLLCMNMLARGTPDRMFLLVCGWMGVCVGGWLEVR